MKYFPYYGNYFIKDDVKKEIIIVDVKNIVTYTVKVENMTCPACESAVGEAIHKQDGIVNLDISYEKGVATIKFDKSKTTIEEIKKSINTTDCKASTHSKL